MINIAIVEDSTELRERMTELVNSNGEMNCKFSFPDAESAIETLKTEIVDIVLMDIHLPGMNGIECLAQLKEFHPEMQFIMCTIFQDDENIFNALKAGAAGYLLKMDEPHTIISSIKELVSGGSPMNPQIARRVIESFQKPAMNVEASSLTKRELEILNLLAKGMRYKEIAGNLFISIDTVRKHINNIYTKLHVQSRMDAINKVFRR